MSETLQLVLYSAVAGVFTAIAPTVLAFNSLRQSKRNEALAKANDEKTDKLIVKTEEIHQITNSAKSEVDEKLRNANEQIADLKRMVDRLINGKTGKAS